MTEDTDKIIRTPDTLFIKLTAEEVHYRNKYLPDPKKLTNEKLVCTVCSKSLVADVHKGEDLFVHRFLQVLVCEGCYTFYGDGCFSSDEDGDDKYCRWCGQGGTLYLCATCTCAFCQKCVKQNLKASVIADLDKDDWKCYMCNPRPLFGTRTICWGAQELNKIGKEKEIERQKKLKEKQEKMNEDRLKENERKSRKDLESSKTKRKKVSDDDSSSPEILPSKRLRGDRRSDKSICKRETRRKHSSSEDLDKKKSLRTSSKSKNNKSYVESSSEDDSDSKIKTRDKMKKKKARESSSESSEKDRKKSNRHEITKKKIATSDDDSDHRIRSKKNRSSKKKEKSSSDSSSNEKPIKKKKKVTDTEDSSDDENDKKLQKVKNKKKVMSPKIDESNCKINKKNSEKLEEIKLSSKNIEAISAEDLIVKKRIKLAILWLNNTIKDIAELGTLISVRAKKFGIKKVNTDNLKNYEDVLNTVTKLKQLISGVHSNYEHIEKNLDAQLKPWKVLIGKDNIDCDIPKQEGETGDISQINKNTLIESNDSVSWSGPVNNSGNKVLGHVSKNGDTNQPQKSDGNVEMNWTGESGDESDNVERKFAKSLISKANETLDRMEELERKDKCIEDNSETESKYLKEEVINESYELFEKSIEADKKSSGVSADEEGSLKEHSIDNDKITNENTPKKICKEGESESSPTKKSVGSVIEKSDSETDKDISLQKNTKKDTEKRSNKKERKITKGERQTLENKSESQGTKLPANHNRTLSSSDESTDFNFRDLKFREKLKNKWEDKPTIKDQILKSSSASQGNKEVTNEKLKPSKDIENNTNKAKDEEMKFSEESLNEHIKTNKNDQIIQQVPNSNAISEDFLEKYDENEEELSKKNIIIGKEQIAPKSAKETKNKQGKTKEMDDSSSEEGKKKEVTSYTNEKSKINKTKSNNKDGFKKLVAEDVYSESISEKDDQIEKVQLLKNKKGDLKEESEKEEDIEKEDHEHDKESIKSKEEDSFKEVPKTKFKGIASSSDDEDISIVEIKSNDDTKNEIKKSKEKVLKKKSIHNLRRSIKSNLLESSEDEDMPKIEKEIQVIESSDEDTKKKKGKKEKDDTVTFTSAESSDSDIFVTKKKQNRKKEKSSDSDASETLNKKVKRKRVRCADSSDESGGSGKQDVSKKSSQGESPGKGGRKNIKKIKKGDDLADATKEAAEEEKERRRRIEDRQKLYNQVFEIKETETVDKLVLDFDLDKKKDLISVNKDLVAKMKPHQAKGVKFMWDSCFESLSELKKSKGSGCILAHCMGLGKTFQVVSLLHTLLLNDETEVRTVMVVCPLSTVLNWYNEFDKWLRDVEGGDTIDVYHLTKCKQNADRARELRHWQDTGGVLIIGYEMFRNLSSEGKKFRPKMRKDFQETLVDPGADIIVCDEGHMLKNEATALSKAMTRVKTLRRIVLTGTPMQNNLKEYHCMVQFVKPNLLGSRKEFLNRFVNPITNGQFVDSTDRDVKVMKRRAHVLHKMLEGLVQRFDYNVLTPFLPPKHEYVISVCLSELQVKLYQHYLENYSQKSSNNKAGSRLFQDWQALGRIWTHPRVIKMSTDKANIKKSMEDDESGEEGSLKDFIDDGDVSDKSTTCSSDESTSGQSIKSEKNKKLRINRSKRTTRSSNRVKDQLLESSEEEIKSDVEEVTTETENKEWWSGMIDQEHLDDINHSGKLSLLFAILKECEAIEDKVLVFSQSLFSLDLIEYFLDKIDAATQDDRLEESLGNYQGTWSKGLDYFRLDGSTSSENRNIWCNAFNREDNPRARLFLISTRAGGLGINLTAANRVIIFDASWNPSHDVQSIFRVYRFGQKKPCYVYRFISHGTMEEKVYDRQVAKQSMSNRVVDEQQVHRHFSSNDLMELYSFTPPSKIEDRPIPVLPKDVLLAEILTQFKKWIEKYHEHDSLLENVEAEELNEEERKLAWEDFENDKKRSLMPTNTGTMSNSMGTQIEILRSNLKAQYPDKTEAELQPMLVAQVTILMRQQQQRQLQERQRLLAAEVQARANQGYSMNPQMFSSANLTQEQMFNLQVFKMQQERQYAKMAKGNIPMTQTHQRVPQNLFLNQRPTLPGQSHLSQLLASQLNYAGKNVQMPKINNINSNAAIEMENLRQKYAAARPSGVSIKELSDDPKPSTS